MLHNVVRAGTGAIRSQVCLLPQEAEDTNGPVDLCTFGILFKWGRSLDLVLSAILLSEDNLCIFAAYGH